MNQDSLGSMMGKPMLDGNDDITGGGGSGLGDGILKDRDDVIDGEGDYDPDPDPDPTTPPSPGGNPLLADFFDKLQVLSSEQKERLLGYVGLSGGDKTAGVSPSEYAELYDISSDYAERFQGMPNLTSLLGDIENVFAYKNQQRGFEQRSAQQAQIAQGGKFQGGMGFSGFGRGRGMTNALSRRSMMDTLKQRQGAVDEAVAGRYGNLLNLLSSKLSSGFNIAGDIVQENPQANVDYGTVPQEGDTKYMKGINYMDTKVNNKKNRLTKIDECGHWAGTVDDHPDNCYVQLELELDEEEDDEK